MNNKVSIERKKKGLSQKQLAKMSGISREYLSNIETGIRIPTITVANKIAVSLDSSIDNIFFSKNVVHDLQKESLPSSQ